MLTDDDRVLGHRLVGDWLEQRGESEAMVIAEHFERGGARDRALRWYPSASRQALEGNDLEGAFSRAARGIASGATGPNRGELLVLQAEAQNWLGANAECLRLGLEAMALLPPGSVPWYTAARDASITAGKTGQAAQCFEIVNALSHAAPEPGAEPERRMALGWAAYSMLVLGERSVAGEILEQLQRAWSPPDLSEPRTDAVIFRGLALSAAMQGRHAEAVKLFVGSAAASERAGDQRNACAEKVSIGSEFVALGAYESAEQILSRALAEARRMGLLTVVPQIKANLGLALLGLGKLESAVGTEKEAAEGMHSQGEPRGEAAARAYLAKILLRQGYLAEAERQARHASAAIRSGPSIRPLALAVLAQVLLAQGRASEAMAPAREALNVLHALGAIEEGDLLVRLTFGETLRALKDPNARRALTSVRNLVVERGATIEDPVLRKSFLERVEENARAMALGLD